jgi:hypothetical protein
MLIKCPECKREVSDKAETCIGCGCPLQKRPKYSVGKCPGCGSYETFDSIEKERREGGFFQALGALMGGKVAGRGRFVCRKCHHEWDFSSN